MKKLVEEILFFLLTITLSASCQDAGHRVFQVGQVIVSTIPMEEKTLSPIECIDDPFLYGASLLLCISDSLAVFDIKSDLYCFRVVNLHSGEYVDFLNKGRGPDEVVTGYFTRLRVVDDKPIMDVDALNEHYLMAIDLEETFRDRRTIIQETVEVPSRAFMSFPIGNEILSFVLFDDDNYSIKQFKKEGLALNRSTLIFGDESYVAEYQPQFESDRKVKPDGTKMVLAMIRFNELDIFDIEGDNHYSVSLSKHSNSKAIIREMLSTELLSTQLYYFGCDVTNESIYALYYDCDLVDLDNTIPEIHVFSWDGRLKAIYHINENLRSIAVTNNGNVLYGMTNDEVIYCYDLG